MAKKNKVEPSQTAIVLRELQRGRNVSKLMAVHHGIGNIADVVMKLRKRGFNILTVTDVDALGRPYTKYVLGPSQQQVAA